MKRQVLVIGNWKMNPSTIGEAKRIFMALRGRLATYARGRTGGATIVVAPPVPYLGDLRKLTMSKRIQLGAQNVHAEKVGPYTGEVSVPMLRSLDAAYVIVGHSERRAMGETDADVHEKVALLLKEKLVPVVCVGEHERAESGTHFEFVERQLRAAFASIARPHAAKAVVAYEPVWAISKGDGKGATATPADIREMQLFIRRVLTDLYGRTTGMAIPVLYGGSVNADNADELAAAAGTDGFLVGGASLDPKAFLTIIQAANNHASANTR